MNVLVVLACAGTSGSCSATYTVKAGDSSDSIAKSYSVTLAAFVAANPQITNPSQIQVGQVVNIPPCSSSPATSGPSGSVSASPPTSSTSAGSGTNAPSPTVSGGVKGFFAGKMHQHSCYHCRASALPGGTTGLARQHHAACPVSTLTAHL